MPLNKVYQIITDRILEALEQGTVPWRKPWKGFAPRNLVSDRAYRGINPFLLRMRGFGSPYWLTYRQAILRGGQVRKGEHGTAIIFWKPYEKKQQTSEGGQEKVKRIALRYYRVFNVEQCSGIRAPELKRPDCKPIEAAEAIVRGYRDAPPVNQVPGCDRAFYTPAKDQITMPERGSFDSEEEFYSTQFHELVHSTGHEKRLNRRGSEEVRHFGDEAYSKEELVAEFGSAFLCGEAEVSPSVVENQAAYIASWFKALKEDPALAVHAASKGQAAADYILGRKEGAVVKEQ